MAECNYDKETLQRSVESGRVPAEQAARLMKSHMSLEHLLELLRVNKIQKVKQIYLLHMSDNNSDEQRIKEEVQKLTGAEVYVC